VRARKQRETEGRREKPAAEIEIWTHEARRAGGGENRIRKKSGAVPPKKNEEQPERHCGFMVRQSPRENEPSRPAPP
jgi:hypothetical protein